MKNKFSKILKIILKKGHPKMTPLVSNGGLTVKFDPRLEVEFDRLTSYGVNWHHLTSVETIWKKFPSSNSVKNGPLKNGANGPNLT